MCEKRSFGSRHAVLASQRRNGKRVRAYFCRDCRAWHATSQQVHGRQLAKPRQEAPEAETPLSVFA